MPDGWKIKNVVCSIDFTIGCDCKMAFNRLASAGFNLQRTGSIPSNSTEPTRGHATALIRGIFRSFLALPSRVFGE
jgi:hypothetical protein